jgi:hypothetical protein
MAPTIGPQEVVALSAMRLDRLREPGENGAEPGEDGMERVAACHCGQLKAIATGEPGRVYLCHCKSCQRRTGSAVHWGTRWEKAQVRLEGETKIYTRKGDSGFDLRFHFCPECGTSILWESDRTPEICGIAGGCFADLDFPAPSGSIYEEAMQSWLALPTVVERYRQAFPPSPPTS